MASSGTPFSSKYSSACSARSRELNTPTAVSKWSPSETHFPGASNAGFPCKPKQTKLYTRFRFSRESVRRLGRATFRGHDSLPVANPFEERVGVRQMDFGHVFRECSHHFVVTYATVDIQRQVPALRRGYDGLVFKIFPRRHASLRDTPRESRSRSLRRKQSTSI